MISSIITIACAFAALLLVSYARKPLTKNLAIFLALSSLIYLDPFFGIGRFGDYVFAFASILASVEPSNSLNLKPRHKSFFIVTAVVIVLITVSEVLGFSQLIPKYIFGMLYCIVGGALFFRNPKKLRSRSAILVVWLGEALKWSATIVGVFYS